MSNWGENDPTYRSYFTPFVTGDMVHCACYSSRSSKGYGLVQKKHGAAFVVLWVTGDRHEFFSSRWKRYREGWFGFKKIHGVSKNQPPLNWELMDQTAISRHAGGAKTPSQTPRMLTRMRASELVLANCSGSDPDHTSRKNHRSSVPFPLGNGWELFRGKARCETFANKMGPKKPVINEGYVVTHRNGPIFFFCFFLTFIEWSYGHLMCFFLSELFGGVLFTPENDPPHYSNISPPPCDFLSRWFFFGIWTNRSLGGIVGGPLISGVGSSGYSPVWGDVWKLARPR